MKVNEARFQLADFSRNNFCLNPEPGTTLEDILEPGYWALTAARMRRGDRIEVFAEDGSFYATLLVTAAAKNWAKVVKLEYYKLVKAEKPSKVKADDYYVKWGSPTTKYRVHRTSDREVIKEEFDTPEAAQEWIADFIKNGEVKAA